jgi:hypothetical protein
MPIEFEIVRHTSTPRLSSLGTDLGGAGLSSFDTADTLLFLGGIVRCNVVYVEAKAV